MAKLDTQSSKERATGSFLPNFCSIRMVFAVVISAELLAVVLTLGSLRSMDSFYSELSMRSLLIQWIALFGAALLCMAGPRIRRLGNSMAGVLSWLLLLGVTLFAALCALALLGWPLNSASGLLFIVESLGISAIMAALLLRYLYIQYLWRQQVEAESEARFQALQSRIRPHFLFNSMNTIAQLTRTDPALAEAVVEDLSDLFRASLGNSQRLSTLGDEIELVRGYLRIEQQRLGDRLEVEWDLEPLPDEAPLPALILQPLFENAVYHGVEPSVGQGVIHVSGRYRRRRVNISIRNTVPVNAGDRRREGNAMAVENIRPAASGFFDGEANLIIGEVDGEYQVRLTFPYPWVEE